jgi:hypothetical protein
LRTASLPKSKRQPDTTGSAADNKGWVLTGRIDFVEPQSNGELVLQGEETQIIPYAWKRIRFDGQRWS